MGALSGEHTVMKEDMRELRFGPYRISIQTLFSRVQMTQNSRHGIFVIRPQQVLCVQTARNGVTAIRILSPNDRLEIDEKIRIFDIRCLRKGPMSSISCGGGVWQIRSATYDDDIENRLIVACMRGGVSHVSISSDCGLLLETSMPFDKELMYGVTCVDSTQNLYACCSFYEHSLYLFSL